MQVSFVKFLFLAILFLPAVAWGQVTDRAALDGDRIPALPDFTEQEPREFHITPGLLESDEGKRALQSFRERRERGHLQQADPGVQSSVGTRETFFVRNIEESNATGVWDEVEFELVRADTDMDVELWVEVDELADDRINEEILDNIWQGLIDETPPNSIAPDKGVVEIGRDLFGEQPNVDGTGILKVLIADIQDGWDPPDQHFFTAGFFDPIDLDPAHSNSNQADIIYINSRPGIYRPVEEENRFVNPRLNTMAHELQHLIHANPDYQNLSLFQNEGQSEMAEILSGFGARGMSFLDSGTQLSGDLSSTTDGRWIYRFRRAEPDVVLYDYQRAQLLHSYMEELIGYEAAGSLTRSSTSNDGAYRDVLDPVNISLDEFFTDFYISAYTNEMVQGRDDFRFSRPQLSNVMVFNPGIFYNIQVQPWVVNREERLYYGGAMYTQWFGVEDLELDIRETDGITQNILYRMVGESQYQLMEAGPGVYTLDNEGIYEEIVLVSVNTEPTGTQASPQDNRDFRYSGQWTTTNLVLEALSYHASPFAFFPIPGDDVFSFAFRISPDFDSGVQSVRFNINARESAVQGEGELQLTLREGVERMDEDGNVLYIPSSEVIASQPLQVSDISTGPNFVGVNSAEWSMQAGREYFVIIEVVEDTGGLYLEFLVDEGSEDTSDPNYYPLRTFVGIQEDGELAGWGSFTNHNNVFMAANLVGFLDIEPPVFPDPPIAESFELVKNYPNPFNSGTTIEYNVPEQAQVRITVHDVLGREVRELFNDVAAPGLHEIHFDGAGLASGLYFYKLRSPEGVQSKKMMLVK
jgi:hypothetical protein